MSLAVKYSVVWASFWI